MTKVLFICKKRPAQYGASYGLLNSCRFIVNALNSINIEAKLVEVIDNNFIDREVHNYKPTHVFIEALWVVPEKFDVLIPLYPNIKWFVRLHSNTPFIANEGVAVDWLVKYNQIRSKYPQFNISPNSLKMVNDLKQSLGIESVYSPNIYQPDKHKEDYIHKTPQDKKKKILDVGCFGAIRPLKNQLIQAMAAITFANQIGQPLHFHINHSRQEQNGENAYKNIKSLFVGTENKLIEHEWLPHEGFISLVKKMDMGLQVSFSETFNIVAADFSHNMIPCVGSEEIGWMSRLYKANPTDLDDIVYHMWTAWLGKRFNLHRFNDWGLRKYNEASKDVWKHLLGL
jgi:hypothetical protein